MAVAVVLFAVVVALAAFDGGYYAPAWGWSSVALAWATLVVVTSRRDVRIGSLGIAWAGAVAAFGGWVWLSATWSVSSTLTLLDAQRALVYVCAAVFVLVAVTTAAVDAVLAATLAAAAVVAAYAVTRYGSAAGTAIAEPIGYSNALGLLAVMGLLLALGFAASGGIRRLAAVAALLPLSACAFLTYARGPLLAFAVGLAVMAGLGRGTTRRFALGAVVATGALLTVMAGRAAATGSALGSTLREDVLTVAANDRDRYWEAAWQTFLAHPVLGSGAGTFERTWLLYRDVNLGVLDAHSLYLETLAELGPLGLALLGCVCVVPLLGAWRARATPMVPAATAAYVAYLSHAAVDWDWEMPAVTLPAVVLGGVLVVSGAGELIRVPTWRRSGLAASVGVVGVAAFLGLMTNSALTAAVVELENGSPRAAEREARRARAWALWSAEPDRLLAEAAAAQGDLRSARRAAATALARDPGNVRLWRLLAWVSPPDRARAFRRIAALDPRGPPPPTP